MPHGEMRVTLHHRQRFAAAQLLQDMERRPDAFKRR
jgi:hypothetical protein